MDGGRCRPSTGSGRGWRVWRWLSSNPMVSLSNHGWWALPPFRRAQGEVGVVAMAILQPHGEPVEPWMVGAAALRQAQGEVGVVAMTILQPHGELVEPWMVGVAALRQAQ